MNHFCTYFDARYMVTGLTMYRSLAEHAHDDFTLWILCLDDVTFGGLSAIGLPHTRLLRLADLERFDPALPSLRATRSTVEYYFTCSPSLVRYVMAQASAADLVIYVDADLFFYSDPAAVLQELDGNSILIFAHRFAQQHAHLEKYGRFNVGFLAFRPDAEAGRCLASWREQCIEWCYDRLEPGRFADQKYLDLWPDRFRGVVISEHAGAGLAPWNIAQTTLSRQNGQTVADGQPLVFFHFHGFRKLGAGVYDTGVGMYSGRVKTNVRRFIFRPYMQARRQTLGFARSGALKVDVGAPRRLNPRGLRYLLGSLRRGHTMLQLGPWIL